MDQSQPNLSLVQIKSTRPVERETGRFKLLLEWAIMKTDPEEVNHLFGESFV